MTAHDLKKAQIILSMYLLITKNPHLTPKDLMDELEISKDRYYRYFDELCTIVPLSYLRKRQVLHHGHGAYKQRRCKES